MPTQAQYIAEFNNLKSQPFWEGISNDQLRQIVAIALGSNGGGGGGTSDATAANQVAGNNSLSSILTELQKRTTIQVVQNLAVGANTIVHNLALPSPFTTVTTIVDNTTGMPISAPISAQSANSLVVNSPIAYPNARITIRS